MNVGAPRPRAIVFDLDGTLADTRGDIAQACNHALTAVGRPVLSVDAVARFVGDGARLLVARALGTSAEDPLAREAFEHFDAFYAAHAADLSGWMPGARESVDACRRHGVRVALATNKPRGATLALVHALELSSYLDAIVAGGDGPLKPDPAPVLGALAPLGVSPADAWMVGDGPQDITAGRAAGVWTLGVLGGFATEGALREAGPAWVLRSLRDFPELLDSVLS